MILKYRLFIYISITIAGGGICNLYAQKDINDRLQELSISTEQLTDLSDLNAIIIGEPDCAIVNFYGTDAMPASRNKNIQAWMEVYDGKGNYFRKKVLMHAQGNSSMAYEKKNIAIDICEDDWIGDETTKITIGNWVSQDSYHLKAFYTDYFKGLGIVGYKLFSQMQADRMPYWERQGVEGNGNARCVPDGFPCEVYLNGNFYGLYAWQLKKNRKNMNMNKDITEHIHLDGNICEEYMLNGEINWSKIDIRNPKKLYCIDTKLVSGQVVYKEYDGDAPKELIDESMPYYDPSNKYHVRTAQVKKYILQLSQYNNEIKAIIANGGTEEEIKAAFEARFDLQSWLDYYVHYIVTMNRDGSRKNWQWFTYNGTKWMVAPYDLDQTFGMFPNALRKADFSVNTISVAPFQILNTYYKKDYIARYRSLRENGVFNADNIKSLVDNRYYRVGESNYKREMLRWPDEPCYNDIVCNENWRAVIDFSSAEYKALKEYSDTITYETGDSCRNNYVIFVATGTTREVPPAQKFAFHDSIDRIHNWIDERLPFLDRQFGLTKIIQDREGCIEAIQPEATLLESKQILTLDGRSVSKLQKGVNLIRLSNGKTVKLLRYE